MCAFEKSSEQSVREDSMNLFSAIDLLRENRQRSRLAPNLTAVELVYAGVSAEQQTEKKSPEKNETPMSLVLNSRLGRVTKNLFSSGSEREEFLRYAANFVERSRMLGQHQEKAQLETLEELATLLDPASDKAAILGRRARERLALDVVKNLANPFEIRQGKNGSCNVASLEVRVASIYPQVYARLAKEVALTGSYRLKDGQQIKLRRNNLDEDLREERGHASRLFQLTAANIGCQTESTYNSRSAGELVVVNAGKGNIRYELLLGALKPGDTGERLIDYSGSEPKEITDIFGRTVDFPKISADQRKRIANELSTGVAELASLSKSPQPDSLQVRDADELHKVLYRLNLNLYDTLRMPLNIVIDTSKPPFDSDYRKGGAHGQHSVTIVAYDPLNKRVSIVDTNGKAFNRLRPSGGQPDRRVPVSQLFEALYR